MADERKRQRKLEKKRLKRAEKRRTLELADSGARPPSDPVSASDALMAVIEPLLDSIDQLPRPQRTLWKFQHALDLGRAAWNRAVTEDGGVDADQVLTPDDPFRRYRLLAPESRQTLQVLMARKRKLFPDDDRVMVDAEAVQTEHGNEAKVTWARFARTH